MIKKVLIITILAAVMLPVGGCKLKLFTSKNKDSKSEKIDLKQSKSGSLEILKKEDVTTVESVKIGSNKSSKVDQFIENKDIDYNSEKVLKPFEVKGESFETTINGNWVVDTTQIVAGKLVYFDIDNPTLKATIYMDSTRQMKVAIQTKDRIYEVPVEKVSFKSKTMIQNSQNTVTDSRSNSFLRNSRSVLDSKVDSKSSEIIVYNTDRDEASLQVQRSTKAQLSNMFLAVFLVLMIVALYYLNVKFGFIRKAYLFIKSLIFNVIKKIK